MSGCAVFDTAIGPCGIAWRGDDPRIDRVQLPDHDAAATAAHLRTYAPDRDLVDATSRAVPTPVRRAITRIRRHLDGKHDDFADLDLDYGKASEFARAVYERLRRVPPGDVLTYGELAHAVGSPGAARAVGRAMASNRHPIVVPCHRVVASDRKLGGFSAPGDRWTKARLLFIEGVVLDAEHAAGMAHVSERDPKLRKLIPTIGPFVPLSHYRADPYDALVEAIIYQQLSTKAARTIAGRVLALGDGERYARPDRLRRIADSTLRGAGLSHQKISYLRDLADHVHRGELPFGRFRSMDDDAVVECLTRVRGFGRWSAEMFLMFHLGRLDVFPIGDLGVRKGMQRVYGYDDEPDRDELERIADRWRPYRSVGSWYMWRALE